jgi:hypothetical protein
VRLYESSVVVYEFYEYPGFESFGNNESPGCKYIGTVYLSLLNPRRLVVAA